LIGEGMSGTTTGALAGISVMEGNLVVALGLSIARDPSLTINPREAITLETNSAPHMILYALANPAPGFHKGDLPVKQQFKGNTLTLVAHTPVAGFLFFPVDRDASHITVVVSVGSETFRFPFARDPRAHAKFGDPEKFPSEIPTQRAAIPSSAASDTPPKSVVETTKANTPVAPKQPSGNQLAKARSNNVPTGQSGRCVKNVSFAVAEGGQVVSRAPKFTEKWIEKNQRKYSGLCFSQTPNARATNLVLVFSTSQSAFNGIYPTVRTSTSSNATPVNGYGTVTDNYGGMWNYTYSGTTTTTTTTTSQVNLPYTDTTNVIYAYSYDQLGRLVSRWWRTITTRQGGDGANTLGYNLGARLGSIHLRERLLKDAVDDVAK